MLNAENVTVRYGAHTVVDRLSFSLEEGQWLMLVGPNGAGKSSLISAIAQGVPYEGEIRLNGRNLRDFRPAELARKIAVLAQQHTISYGYTVEEIVQLGRYAHQQGLLGRRDEDGPDAIERALGIPSGTGGTIWRHVNGIRDYFGANPGYLLIVDEADKLVSKYTSKKMEILRAIYDQTDVGLVIAGEPKLEMQIKSYLTRFANRVDFYASLHGLQAGEVADYLKNYDIDEAALAELKSRACNMQNGCFRLLDRTLRNVDRILRERGSQAVTAEVIREASGLMML